MKWGSCWFKGSLTSVTREGDEKKSTYFTEAEIEFEWINAENPEEDRLFLVRSRHRHSGRKGVGKETHIRREVFPIEDFQHRYRQ